MSLDVSNSDNEEREERESEHDRDVNWIDQPETLLASGERKKEREGGVREKVCSDGYSFYLSLSHWPVQ